MKALRDEPEIMRMANALRVGPGDPVEQIIAFCKARVETWCGKGRRKRTIEEIERALKMIPAKTKLLTVEGAGHDLGFKGKAKKEELPQKIFAELASFLEL